MTEPIDYRPISAMIQELPKDRRWSKDQRDRWMRAMTAVVDLLITVDSDAAPVVIGLLPHANPSIIGDR